MVRKAFVLALAVIGILALGGTATAATLPTSTAQKLARQLALKQVKTRGVVAYDLGKGKREGQNRIVYAYDDRTKKNVFCTGSIVVSGPVNRIVKARFAATKCAPIPVDALAIETAALQAAAAVKTKVTTINSGLAALKSSLKPCAALKPPPADRKLVSQLVQASLVGALEVPVDAQLAAFVGQLAAIPTTATPTFTAATAAWGDYLTALRAVVAQGKGTQTCAAIKAWAAKGYAAASAPVDFGALAKLDKRTALDIAVITRAARLLAKDGVFARAVLGYTPDGLLLQLEPKNFVLG